MDLPNEIYLDKHGHHISKKVLKDIIEELIKVQNKYEGEISGRTEYTSEVEDALKDASTKLEDVVGDLEYVVDIFTEWGC